VWTHCQGVYPLRAALARTLRLDPSTISVRHVQGPGCYGHNGADDAATDAAVIALRMRGRPIRVRWRRQEEFAFEPVSPAMVVKVSAKVDDAGRPVDWTTEIWSGTHQGRPGGGATLLAAEALPDPPPIPAPIDIPEGAGGGATRNGAALRHCIEKNCPSSRDGNAEAHVRLARSRRDAERLCARIFHG
jgi:nicotinate dehydrogenase subunit B